VAGWPRAPRKVKNRGGREYLHEAIEHDGAVADMVLASGAGAHDLYTFFRPSPPDVIFLQKGKATILKMLVKR
jgi:hypothetical protein